MGNTVIAIEFGTTKIACMAAEKNNDQIVATAYRETESDGIIRGEIMNVKTVFNKTKDLLDAISSDIGSPVDSAIVGISGQFIKTIVTSRTVQRENCNELITEDEIESISRSIQLYRVSPDEVIIKSIPQYYNIDDNMNEPDPEGMTGSQIEAVYKLVVGRSRAMENMKITMGKLGIDIRSIVLRPIASAESVLSEDEREVGTAIVDIGGGTTELAIVKDGIVRHVAVIPFAGNTVTEDIKQTFGVTFRNSERIKIKEASCLLNNNISGKTIKFRDSESMIPVKQITKVVEARMVEILEAVLYEIRQSGMSDQIPGGIVFTGGGAQMQHLASLARIMSGKNVRIAYPGNQISSTSCKQAFTYGAASLVGMILHYYRNHEDKIEEEAGDSMPDTADIADTRTGNKGNEEAAVQESTGESGTASANAEVSEKQSAAAEQGSGKKKTNFISSFFGKISKAIDNIDPEA